MVISFKKIVARFFTSPLKLSDIIHRPYATVITEPFGWAKNQQLNHGPSATSYFSTHHSQAAQVDKEIIKKYQDKLKKKAQEEGKNSIEELLETRLSRSKSVEQGNQVNKHIQDSPKIVPPKVTEDPSKAALSSILKLDKIMNETPETIAQVWKSYHEDKSCLSATIPGETYRVLSKKFREFPQFLLPLPRDTGHEFYFMQTHFHQIYFTSLGEYKLHGSQARPHLIITHYPELLTSKNIILMRGELGSFEGAQVPISLEDAKLLVIRLQQFYLTESPAKKALVSIFNKNPTEFDHRSLLEEADKLD